jgi:hypothetical protein
MLRETKSSIEREVKEKTDRLTSSALESLSEELQTLHFGWVKNTEAEILRLKHEIAMAEDAAKNRMKDISLQCGDFVSQTMKCLNVEPLVEVHAAFAASEFCHAQVGLLSSAMPSKLDVHSLQSRVRALEVTLGKFEPPSNARAQDPVLRGLLNLFELDEDVIAELSDVYDGGEDVSQIKVKYLHSLPVFAGLGGSTLAGASQDQSATVAATPKTPYRSAAKEVLLHEIASAKGHVSLVTKDTLPTPERLSLFPFESSATTAEGRTPEIPKFPPFGIEVGDSDCFIGGVVVISVTADSPADRYDVRPNDVIMTVNDNKVSSRTHFALLFHSSGKFVKLGLYRPSSARMYSINAIR